MERVLEGIRSRGTDAKLRTTHELCRGCIWPYGTTLYYHSRDKFTCISNAIFSEEFIGGGGSRVNSPDTIGEEGFEDCLCVFGQKAASFLFCNHPESPDPGTHWCQVQNPYTFLRASFQR